MKVLQINTSVNSGSTGRITEEIGKLLNDKGHLSFIAGADTEQQSSSHVIKIGSEWNKRKHGLKTRLFDRHGFGSYKSTIQLVKEITLIKPDIIHLHNIHGYYLHIRVLFDYLKTAKIPIVWTFHDCWPFTGHCSYFDAVNCYKWQTECNHCPNLKAYPSSWGIDQSKRNFLNKRHIFNGIRSLQIIAPSKWMVQHVNHSFLSSYPLQFINYGIDLNAFAPTASSESVRTKYNLTPNPILLGVASIWDKRKGLDDFIRLSYMLNNKAQIVLVGLTNRQMEYLPWNITGIERTENIGELVALYSAADVFVNPTYVDNFPTTNLEALACGTPVVTYNTGGSPEAIDDFTGKVVEKGNIEVLYSSISEILLAGKNNYESMCRSRAEKLYSSSIQYNEYLNLYKKLVL